MSAPVRYRHSEDCCRNDQYSDEITECDCGEQASQRVTSVSFLREVDQPNEEVSLNRSRVDYSPVFLDSCDVVEDVVNRTLAPKEEALRFFVGEKTRGQTVSSDIGFICQANTTLMECHMQAAHIHSLSGTYIDTIYNNSRKWNESKKIMSGDARVQLLIRSWDDFFNRNSNNNLCRLQFCAGDATYIVRQALEAYGRRDRIIVVAIAPSCIIPAGLCLFARYYSAFCDIVSEQNPGNDPSVMSVSSSPQARGILDESFHSSTFQEILRMEALCFKLRQRLLFEQNLPGNFDEHWQFARELFVQDHDRLENIPPWLLRTPIE